MRKIIVDNNEVIIDDPDGRHKSRNQSGDKVAKEKEEKSA